MLFLLNLWIIHILLNYTYLRSISIIKYINLYCTILEKNYFILYSYFYNNTEYYIPWLQYTIYIYILLYRYPLFTQYSNKKIINYYL